MGSAVGNTNGGGCGAPASASGAGRFDGTGRGAVGTGRVGASVGIAGVAGAVTVAAGVAGAVGVVGVGVGTAAGVTIGGGDGGPELSAIVPVPTRMPSTLAPRSNDRPMSAATGTRRRGDACSPGAIAGMPVLMYAGAAIAVGIGGARTVSMCGSSRFAPVMAGDAAVRTGPGAPMATVPLGACARAFVDGRFPVIALSSARRISVAVENRISGRAAIAWCTRPARSRGARGPPARAGSPRRARP